MASDEWRMVCVVGVSKKREANFGRASAYFPSLPFWTPARQAMTSTDLFKSFVFVIQTSQRLLKATELPIRLTWPGLKRRALAGTNFVSMYLHSSKKSGFSKWPNTLKTRREDHLFYTLAATEKEINRWLIKYTYFTLLSMYTTSGGRRGSLISTCPQKNGQVQFKKWHTQMNPLPPHPLKISELKQLRRRRRRQQERQNAIRHFTCTKRLQIGGEIISTVMPRRLTRYKIPLK